MDFSNPDLKELACLIYETLKNSGINAVLVPDLKSFQINFGVKAAQIDDRKSIRIRLIRKDLRSPPVVDFSTLSR